MGKERSVLLLGSFTLFWLCFLTFPIKYCCFAVYGSEAVYEKDIEEGWRSWNSNRIRQQIGTGLNHRPQASRFRSISYRPPNRHRAQVVGPRNDSASLLGLHLLPLRSAPQGEEKGMQPYKCP